MFVYRQLRIGQKPHSGKTTSRDVAPVAIKHHLLMSKQIISIGD
jgi:hypothetical protein